MKKQGMKKKKKSLWISNKMFDALAKFIKDYKHNDTIKNYSELYTKEKNKYNNMINKINTENINQRDIEAELYNIYNNIEKYISEINIFYNEKKKEEEEEKKKKKKMEEKRRKEEEEKKRKRKGKRVINIQNIKNNKLQKMKKSKKKKKKIRKLH